MAGVGGFVTAGILLVLEDVVWDVPILAVISVLLHPWILVGVGLDISVDTLSLETAVFFGWSTLANMVLWGLVGGWFLEPWAKEEEMSLSGRWTREHRILLGQVAALALLVLVAGIAGVAGFHNLPRPGVLAGSLVILGGVLGASVRR